MNRGSWPCSRKFYPGRFHELGFAPDLSGASLSHAALTAEGRSDTLFIRSSELYFFYGKEITTRAIRQKGQTRQEVRRKACGFEAGRRLRGPPEAPEKFLAGAPQEPLCYHRPFPRIYARVRPLPHPVQRARAGRENTGR